MKIAAAVLFALLLLPAVGARAEEPLYGHRPSLIQRSKKEQK